MAKNPADHRISKISHQLYDVSKKIRILTHLGWPGEIKQEFFRRKASWIPEVNYPSFDSTEILQQIDDITRGLHGHPADKWLLRQATVLGTSARMLSAVGTPEFYRQSRVLYGAPTDTLLDGSTTSLGLAQTFDALLDTFSNVDLGVPDPACHLAQTVADEMKKAVDSAFGADAPEVFVVDTLSANALAGAKRIRIRKGACFTDRDIVQLINHEAYIHVATSLNGRHQQYLPLLGAGHAGTTRTQEGLAVFAEFITASMDIDRMRRLSDRVIAVQMAIDGADFMEVFRYFEGRVGNADQAFENTRRVFRGGMTSGGVPFTKDIVYLDGLLRVHNFLRAIVSSGRVDCLPLMFVGKLDIEDIPMLCELFNQGLCLPPRFLPPWAKDKRFLLSYLAYSSFLNSVDMKAVGARYQGLLESAPLVNLT